MKKIREALIYVGVIVALIVFLLLSAQFGKFIWGENYRPCVSMQAHQEVW